MNDMTDVSIAMGLSNSDLQYLNQETAEHFDFNTAEQVQQLTTKTEDTVASLTSGKLATNSVLPTTMQNWEQSHFVQSHVNVVTPVANESSISVANDQLSANIDSGIASSPLTSGTATLSSALKGLNLVNNLPNENAPAIPGPFQIIGHTGNVDVHGITELQILDTNGKPIQVPVQLVTTNNDECAIHLLSLQVDDQNDDVKVDTECQQKENAAQMITSEETDLANITSFEQPCQTSTPAIHIDGLNDTILAGNLQKAVHGPTPDALADIENNLPEMQEKPMKSTTWDDDDVNKKIPTPQLEPPAEYDEEKKNVEEENTMKSDGQQLMNRKIVPANAINYMGKDKKKGHQH